MENPSVAKTITDRSIRELAFHAARTPIGIARLMAITSVIIARDRVGTTHMRMRFITGCLDTMDVPRSPRSMSLNQMPNWTGRGRLRPSASRIAWTSHSWASCQAIRAAGSPGESRISPKTISDTTRSTGMVARMRLIT